MLFYMFNEALRHLTKRTVLSTDFKNPDGERNAYQFPIVLG